MYEEDVTHAITLTGSVQCPRCEASIDDVLLPPDQPVEVNLLEQNRGNERSWRGVVRG